MAVEDLKNNSMMAHLLESLNRGEDIGHYGRLVFAMVARHFMEEEDLVALLRKNPEVSEGDARSLCRQVEGRDYNPPRRERILEWQKQQSFPICPADDPDACNVYRDLKFPQHVYDHIQQYYEHKSADEAPSARR
jgi:hypothetical protein